MLIQMSKQDSKVVVVTDLETAFDSRAACVCVFNVIIICITCIVITVLCGEYQLKANDIYNMKLRGNLMGISYR